MDVDSQNMVRAHWISDWRLRLIEKCALVWWRCWLWHWTWTAGSLSLSQSRMKQFTWQWRRVSSWTKN